MSQLTYLHNFLLHQVLSAFFLTQLPQLKIECENNPCVALFYETSNETSIKYWRWSTCLTLGIYWDFSKHAGMIFIVFVGDIDREEEEKMLVLFDEVKYGNQLNVKFISPVSWNSRLYQGYFSLILLKSSCRTHLPLPCSCSGWPASL